MTKAARRATTAIGILGALILLSALLGLLASFSLGPRSIAFALVNLLLMGWLAIGLMRGAESAWAAFLVLGGAMAAFQLALGLGARDPTVLLAGALNATLVGLVIWAGRHLPDEREPAEGVAPA